MKRWNIQTHPELKNFSLPNLISLSHSLHAQKRAEQKEIELPILLKVDGNVVELESVGRSVTKLVIRMSSGLNDGWDWIYVVVPLDSNAWKLVTCWKNRFDDTHETLNRSRLA